ncbi:hypothetical protein ADL22_26750 [Streptomyces sp. NRRL F-4489]|uniref:DUF2752 domain-containing protein n=1 Tax=Streptomyces sp. NRRL F-4489 TaxID=1609095 RepID=UPI000747683A|nr:DUF2752 domain-containing protein [Streptomyces sp. NRRL F-4489]KUL35625.1 hypothetical protein ADL22_26750 [Streptomyces sp. NRRL F-4489]
MSPEPPLGPAGAAAPEAEAAAVRRRTLCRAGAALGLGALGAVYLWHTDPHQPGQLLIPCPFRLMTGLLCPFCGGTRMAYDLMHGDLVTAFHDNAVLLVLGGPAVAWAAARWLAAGLRGRHRPLRLTARGNAVVLGIAAVWMVARNIIS